MQRKLLYSSALCALFGISNMLLGMEKPHPADFYTFLTLSTNNNENFIAIPKPGLNHKKIPQDYKKFNSQWEETGYKEYNEKIGYRKRLNGRIRISTGPSVLIITDDLDNQCSSVSVLVHNRTMIKLGSVRTSTIKQFKKYYTDNKSQLSLFIIGNYYPIKGIIHSIPSEEMKHERQIAINDQNAIKQRKEIIIKSLESIIKSNTWILLCGAGIAGLFYLFPEKFTQFFQSFRNA